MDRSKIEKAYQRVAAKNPEITNERHLELLTRAYIMRQKKVEAGIFFFAGALGMIVLAILPTLETVQSLADVFVLLLALVAPICMIVGVCKFAGAMHDPLTPNEERELSAYEELEKTGKTNTDLSEFDNSAYLQYEQEKYRNASLFKKFFILVKRINVIVWLFIGVLILGGAGSTIAGAHNILTYEERNKNAVEIQAVVIGVEEDYDTEDDTVYEITYEYTYKGTSYTIVDNSSDPPAIGGEKTILIDSLRPERQIINDGEEKLCIGGIGLSIGILILVYSLLSARKNIHVSPFNLLWLCFAAAAIGFAVWGISLFFIGMWGGGLLVLLVGCPIWIVCMLLFKAALGPKN